MSALNRGIRAPIGPQPGAIGAGFILSWSWRSLEQGPRKALHLKPPVQGAGETHRPLAGVDVSGSADMDAGPPAR